MTTARRFLAKNGLDNNSKTISNVADPVDNQDVVTKAYLMANASSTSVSFTIKSSNYTFVDKDNIAADTTAATITLTLPLNPTPGTSVRVIDYAGTFDTNNLTIARNGSNIMGLAEDLVCNTKNLQLVLSYIDATQGWKFLALSNAGSFSVIEGAGGGGGTTITGVTSVNTRTGAVVLTKNDVGLSNVNNIDSTNAANLTSGTIALARIGTGTPSISNYLRGDGSWANIAASGLTFAGAVRYINNNWATPVNTAFLPSTTIHKSVSLAGTGVLGEYTNNLTTDITVNKAAGTITVSNNNYLLFISFECAYNVASLSLSSMVSISIDTVPADTLIHSSSGYRWQRVLTEQTVNLAVANASTGTLVSRLNIEYVKDVAPGTTLYLSEQYYGADSASTVTRTEVLFTLVAVKI